MGVDVLAVMDRAIDGLPYSIDDELEIARAAVAELIEAASVVMQGFDADGNPDEAYDVLRAALARATGATDGR